MLPTVALLTSLASHAWPLSLPLSSLWPAFMTRYSGPVMAVGMVELRVEVGKAGWAVCSKACFGRTTESSCCRSAAWPWQVVLRLEASEGARSLGAGGPQLLSVQIEAWPWAGHVSGTLSFAIHRGVQASKLLGQRWVSNTSGRMVYSFILSELAVGPPVWALTCTGPLQFSDLRYNPSVPSPWETQIFLRGPLPPVCSHSSQQCSLCPPAGNPAPSTANLPLAFNFSFQSLCFLKKEEASLTVCLQHV